MGESQGVELIRSAAGLLELSDAEVGVAARAGAAAAASAGSALLQLEHSRAMAADPAVAPYDVEASPLTASPNALRLRATNDLRAAVRHGVEATQLASPLVARRVAKLLQAVYRAQQVLDPAGQPAGGAEAPRILVGDRSMGQRQRPRWSPARTADLG